MARNRATEILEGIINGDPALRALFTPAREARTRRFECLVCKAWFTWSTERLGDGKYASAEYHPYGPGARSGKAEKWRIRGEVHHSTRTAAKARALARWRQHRDTVHLEATLAARAKAQARHDAQQARMRREWFERTGKWRDEWGPRPVIAIAVAS